MITDSLQADWQVPERVSRLKDLAYNLWWSWHPDARALFKTIDRVLWIDLNYNPVHLLQQSHKRLEDLSKDAKFLARYDVVIRQFDRYLKMEETWFSKSHPESVDKTVAYFSAEFGLHNSLRTYSGGLGILAGDHCKTASDLGIPLVGVGFMYPQGYVQQRIGVDGWQQNVYEPVNWHLSPMRPVLAASGEPFLLDFILGTWALKIAVWEVGLGRARIYLMDTNVEGNSPADREISSRLYVGDRSMRLRQELILGIGGVRLLRALKIPAAIYHANEGHSAFLYLELAREAAAAGRSPADIFKDVADKTVFTTHTPVEAGHDVFDEHAIAEYFKDYWKELGLSRDEFLDMGRVPGQQGWNMTALALRMAGKRNAVSRRHAAVSRRMWTKLWPGKAENEIPIDSVTNGVHLATWLEQDMAKLFAKHLGADWWMSQDEEGLWQLVDAIPDDELWAVHQKSKDALFSFLRVRVRERWMKGLAEPSQVLAQGSLLSPAVLTVGFARRFAGYKRATLVLRDLDRLKSILLHPHKPVQILFAGKAHPDDDPGKSIIQHIYRMAKDSAFGGRIAFVEDYDMQMARYLVHGCDLWLNNPVPPLEACGTSGQKAAVNGVPNLSVLDGWWEEGFSGTNGWGIGIAGGRPAETDWDAADASEIYEALENKIVPLFYDRGSDKIPHGWIKVMKDSIRSAAPRFCGNRMVKEYVERLYLPAPVKVGA
ncbi:MAG: alpha-glucan family phosphorylase [Elusimicrobiota bacterium]